MNKYRRKSINKYQNVILTDVIRRQLEFDNQFPTVSSTKNVLHTIFTKHANISQFYSI